MEYCEAGSVSDIMKLRGKTVNRTKKKRKIKLKTSFVFV